MQFEMTRVESRLLQHAEYQAEMNSIIPGQAQDPYALEHVMPFIHEFLALNKIKSNQ